MKKTIIRSQLAFATALTLAVLLTAAAPAAAATAKKNDWPHWSGPDRNMTSLGNGVFDRESFGLEVAWTREIGSAYAGIVVVDGKLVTGFAEDESDFMAAFDATNGRELWRYRIGDYYAGHDGSDDGPIATPTVHDGVVFGLGGWGHLFALDLRDGRELWAHHIAEDYGARKPRYGFTTTPTVIAGKLVVQMGGENGRSVVAFEPKTGEMLWSQGDDMIGYQSPMGITVGGSKQIVAVSDANLAGLDPENGEVLWYHELEGEGEDHGHSQPVPVGDEGILLGFWTGHKIYRVGHDESGYKVKEAWNSRHLRGTYAVPTPYGDHLYGFAGRFLTCVDASSGELVWKSRPPGGWNLVLVDGHVVVLSSDGELVVAEASPDGYKEKARVQALDRGYYTRPSFADGHVYVRNLTQLTAVRVTDAPARVTDTAPRKPEPELRGLVGDFVRELRQAEDKGAKIDAFFARHERSPILEGDDLVHFVYRGDDPDLALGGTMIPSGELLMHRVEGTDFWFRTLELPPKSYYTYYLSVFEDQRPDPRNPKKTEADQQELSILETRGFEVPSYLDEPAGPRGTIEKLTWKSEIMGNEREVQVYLPPGYESGEARHPVLFHHHGDRVLGQTKVANVLDNLSGKAFEPTIVAFVPRVDGAEYAGPQAAQYVDALAEELVARLDEAFRTRTGPEARGAFGPGSGGTISIYSALRRPDVFGHAAAVDFYYGSVQEELASAIEATKGENDSRFFVRWSRFGYQPPTFPDAVTESQDLIGKLREGGLDVRADEVGHGHGWDSWQLATEPVLGAFFPLE